MIWILLLSWKVGYAGASLTADFASKAACEDAGRSHAQAISSHALGYGSGVVWNCAEKGNP